MHEICKGYTSMQCGRHSPKLILRSRFRGPCASGCTRGGSVEAAWRSWLRRGKGRKQSLSTYNYPLHEICKGYTAMEHGKHSPKFMGCALLRSTFRQGAHVEVLRGACVEVMCTCTCLLRSRNPPGAFTNCRLQSLHFDPQSKRLISRCYMSAR